MKKRVKGSAIAEYALLVVLVSIAAIAGMQAMGTNANATLTDAAGTIGGAP